MFQIYYFNRRAKRKKKVKNMMKEGKLLIFIEVRYRKSKRYGTGIDSVTKEKQRREEATQPRRVELDGPNPVWVERPGET